MSSSIRQSVQATPVVPAVSIDPYLLPAFPLANRLLRAVWGFVYLIFFRTSPRPFHAWRALLLRCFGARLGKNCHIYGGARIWAPWNLTCEEQATIGDEAIVYNPAPVRLGSHAIISQQAYLCGATHDYEDPRFPLVASPISIGSYAWVCARATVQAGVSVGEGAVLALGSVATHDLQPWTVYGGIPARKIKVRRNVTSMKLEPTTERIFPRQEPE
jgi:putative colanic acid biosynthesis acetyltransferase WcaF